RDFHVTGVQTCALPISRVYRHRHESLPNARLVDHDSTQVVEILVEEFEIADYGPVFCSELELFEMDQVESPINLVDYRYRGMVQIGRASCREMVQRWVR